jgi:hypothetical protein
MGKSGAWIPKAAMSIHNYRRSLVPQRAKVRQDIELDVQFMRLQLGVAIQGSSFD